MKIGICTTGVGLSQNQPSFREVYRPALRNVTRTRRVSNNSVTYFMDSSLKDRNDLKLHNINCPDVTVNISVTHLIGCCSKWNEVKFRVSLGWTIVSSPLVHEDCERKV